MKWLKKYWLVLTVLIAVVIVIALAFIPNCTTNSITKEVVSFLESLSVIVVGFLGLVWAYPLLKRKATESYVEKQVDIIFEANWHLREKCISLLDKYPLSMRSNDLDKQTVEEALEDVRNLYYDSIEANYDAYRYAYLLYGSVNSFYKYIANNIPNGLHAHYYKEDFYSFLHNHIDQILQYASTIDSIARMSVDSKKKLVKSIDKYVVGNDSMVLPGINGKIRFKKADSLLVLFFSNNMELPEGMHLLHESCFKIIPNGSSFARIMENQKWYAPIQLKLGDFFVFKELILDLVAYRHKVSQSLENGIVESYTILYYSNISNIAFVDTYANKKDTFNDIVDTYIGKSVLKSSDIDDFWVEGERVGIKIKKETLKQYYMQVRDIIKSVMSKEV